MSGYKPDADEDGIADQDQQSKEKPNQVESDRAGVKKHGPGNATPQSDGGAGSETGPSE